MIPSNRILRQAIKKQLPKDVVPLLRRRFGTPRPWDPGVVLTPPAPPPGHVAGPPDFVGVGTQKSGTTWWHEVINSHPAVHSVAGAHKERHFFGRFHDQDFGPEHVAEYHRWFTRPEGKLVGEWTPGYLNQAWTPPLLASAAPGTKILVMLRDPVERFQSGLTHYAARDWSVDERLTTEAIVRGLYGMQLERLLRSYPREQILVLQYEACRADREGQARRTFEFLGIDPDVEVTGLSSQKNVTRMEKVPLADHMRAVLDSHYAHDAVLLRSLVPEIDLDLWPNVEAP